MRHWWCCWLLLSMLLPQALWAACTTANLPVSGAGAIPPRRFTCATYADAPVSGLHAGDSLFAADTGASYLATTATTWTQQAGGRPVPTSALSALGTGTKVATTSVTAPASNKCLEMDSSGTLVIAGTNAACGAGGGGGTVSTTGSPVSGNLTQFSGATTITTGNLAGDVTTSGTLTTTVAKVNGVAYPAAPSLRMTPVVTAANTVTYQTVTGPIYHVLNYGAKCDGTTDDTAAVQATINAAATWGTSTGGTVMFPAGMCVINGAMTIPIDMAWNTAGSQPHQLPVRLTGQTSGKVGQQNHPTGGTILLLGYVGVAKIDTRGAGILEVDHVTLQQNGGATDATPFIHTTNTMLYVHDNVFLGWEGTGPPNYTGALAQTTCIQDAIVLGDNGGGTGSQPNQAFQGYGTLIDNNLFYRTQRAVYIQAAGHAVLVSNNDIQRNAGSSQTTPITGATNASPARLTVSGHGFRVGSTLSITMHGWSGTWASMNGTFTMYMSDVNTWDVYTTYPGTPKDSSSFGAFTGQTTAAFFSGAAFEVNALNVMGSQANGIRYTNNLVEVDGYAYGFKVVQYGNNEFYSGNNIGDGTAGLTIGGYRFEASSGNNTVITGRRSDVTLTQIHVSDVGGTSTVLDGAAGGGSNTLGNPISSNVVLNQNLTTAPTPLAGTMLQLVPTDTTSPVLEMFAFGAQPRVTLTRADGTNAQPLAVTTDDILGQFGARGYDGVAYASAARGVLQMRAGSLWTNSPGSHETYARLLTTPAGTTAAVETARFTSAGGFTVGSTAQTASGVVNVLTGFTQGGTTTTSGTATLGHVLRGNGTVFVDAALAASDLSNGVSGSGAVVLATSPTLTTPTIAALANLTSNGFVQTSGGTGTLGIVPDPLGVTHGGTGTATTFTDGSVHITGAGGIYTQDNSNLFWNRTTARLGIGVNDSTAPGATLATPLTVAVQTTTGNINMPAYTASAVGPALRGIKFRGTQALPTAALNNDILMSSTGAGGFDSTGASGSDVAQIRARAGENFSSTNQASYWEFRTTPTGGSITIATRMLIDPIGTVVIGASLPATGLGGALLFKGVVFASLGTPDNGTLVFCTDCDPPTAIDQTCTNTGAKTGSLAFRVNGVWKCLS